MTDDGPMWTAIGDGHEVRAAIIYDAAPDRRSWWRRLLRPKRRLIAWIERGPGDDAAE